MDLTNLISRFATGMNGTKWMLLFFAPFYQISRTDDRTKANILERKRIAIAHAKFVLAENTHYLRTFRIMALVTRQKRVTIAPITAWLFALVIMYIMASFWRATIAPIITWLLCRVTRAITQVILTYRYCAFCDEDFTARYIAYGDVHFAFDICALSQALLWRVIRVIRQVVLTRCYSAFDSGVFRAIISIILVFTCNQVQSI